MNAMRRVQSKSREGVRADFASATTKQFLPESRDMVSLVTGKEGGLRMSDWDDLTAAAIAGKLNRRDFLLRATALGVTATMASSVLSRTALADTPKKGGTLKL